MDMFANLLLGFQTVFQPVNLLYCFVGVFIGTSIGVLPGIGPPGAMAILLPFTFAMPPVTAIILIAGIYYGAMYGGSTTSILVNIPGEASSVVTCLDGYQMARQGRAGAALGISAFGSFIGGTFSIIALMFLMEPLSRMVLRFGPAEYFSVMVLGLTLVIYLVRGSVAKGIIMALAGFILRTVGLDRVTGFPRFTFGTAELMDGIGMVPLTMGLLGISELIHNLGREKQTIVKTKIKNLLPNLADWKRSIGPIGRGTLLGYFSGIFPGVGSVIPSFFSYSLEKKLSRHPEEFGKGAIEGVAGPETANNAGAGGAFVPLLVFGVPPNVSMALLLGAFMIHGVIPGPSLVRDHPQLLWGTIASMYVGNLMLLVLNLPLIGMWVQFLKVPYRTLMPLIMLFCIIGAYSANGSILDIIFMMAFGLLGYLFRRHGYEAAPLVLAFVLEPMLETNFRRTLILSHGDLSVFLARPISAVFLTLAVLLLISSGFSFYRQSKPKLAE